MNTSSSRLGINGMGRIGKLTLWHHIARKHFDELVVNLGRPVGKSMADIAHYVERDSTYGFLADYLHGHGARPVIQEIDNANQSLVIDGIRVWFLLENRNPQAIDWKSR